MKFNFPKLGQTNDPKRSLTSGDQEIESLVIGILAGDGEVPPLHGLAVLRGHKLANLVKTLHSILQLLLEPVDHGGPGPVRGRTRSTSRQVTVRGIGPLQRLELQLDQLRLLQRRRNVAVHA